MSIKPRPVEFKELRDKLFRLNPDQQTKILRTYGGTARDVNDLHPRHYPAVIAAVNDALDEPRRRKQEKDDKQYAESAPDGFKDASG
jgi:hypothetical protein